MSLSTQYVLPRNTDFCCSCIFSLTANERIAACKHYTDITGAFSRHGDHTCRVATLPVMTMIVLLSNCNLCFRMSNKGNFGLTSK